MAVNNNQMPSWGSAATASGQRAGWPGMLTRDIWERRKHFIPGAGKPKKGTGMPKMVKGTNAKGVPDRSALAAASRSNIPWSQYQGGDPFRDAVRGLGGDLNVNGQFVPDAARPSAAQVLLGNSHTPPHVGSPQGTTSQLVRQAVVARMGRRLIT